ncbi:MAG TPA: dTDP-4-dehydrorhamnose reductase [Pirellulales bacterium]|jgi:dTDP-4-dehydrorhamnose reductase|nr:dTDP-4-dehydrorhamnose reductase [Pirellulales bacterium]
MTTILLTGAAGQVGRELLHSLAALGTLHATVRTPSNSPALSGSTALHLADFEAVRELVMRLRPQVIVNPAAYTAVDQAESETAAAERLNAELPRVLAECAAACDALLVHYSTDYVFDGSGTRPWREDDRTGPLNAYGRTKLAGEEAIRRTGARHLIFRTSWVYGVHGKNFVKTMLRLGAERKQLRVVSDQIGAPTSARVIADVTAQVLAQARGDISAWANEHAGTYHLACAGETSWHAFAQQIFASARAAGVALVVDEATPIASSEYPTPAVRPLNSRLDKSLLAQHFGLQPPDWQQALDASLEEIVRAG